MVSGQAFFKETYEQKVIQTSFFSCKETNTNPTSLYLYYIQYIIMLLHLISACSFMKISRALFLIIHCQLQVKAIVILRVSVTC